ncbi:MAG: DNA-3-methyladenine glycosylase I [Magnetococcales bacterium]|nr:DNA-3-methyladenine glycosylase I [Magnetococcales bacterium]|tara:strand:- start:18362 stop:18913 length:552 start_codon:yes stop_codon:yes gene_type:complete
MQRCAWVTDDEIYKKYHDEEWGRPVHDDRKLFEFLVLEGAQAGLSWLTVLKKREHYKKVFDGFNPEKVANYDDKKIQALLNDAGIIRNKLKINSAVRNAKVFLKIQQEFGSFDAYIWGFVAGKPVINHFKSTEDVPAKTVLSDRISKDLQKRGMNFVGSTIVYAYMQAIGMVNDHTLDCFCRA